MTVKSQHVYDKAKYHSETIEKRGLSKDHAANHAVFFLRWLIERGLMSEFFEKNAGDILKRFRTQEATIHEVYSWWDRCLMESMLSVEGNAFAIHYFDFERGRYIHDYGATLKRDLPTEFHIEFNESNYAVMKQVIDRRYEEWKPKPKKKWWQF